MKMGIIRCTQTEDYCPGTTDFRVLLVERGADAIAFASCIGQGTPIGYPCPFFQKMLEAIKKDLPENVRVFEYTH